MASHARLILETLDRHLSGPAHIRLLGGAAFILAYGRNRTTEDADLLLDDREVQTLIEQADFGEALEATNAELEPLGLYLTLGPLDLICSKLARADDLDLEDIEWLVMTLSLPVDSVLEAARTAIVPDVLRSTWAAAIPRLEARLRRMA